MVVFEPGRVGKTFGFKTALFPYDNPALFSMAIAFIGIWLVSKLSTPGSGAGRTVEAQYVRSETGIGAAEARWRTSEHTACACHRTG
jgi:cation/acetate symporter